MGNVDAFRSKWIIYENERLKWTTQDELQLKLSKNNATKYMNKIPISTIYETSMFQSSKKKNSKNYKLKWTFAHVGSFILYTESSISLNIGFMRKVYIIFPWYIIRHHKIYMLCSRIFYLNKALTGIYIGLYNTEHTVSYRMDLEL